MINAHSNSIFTVHPKQWLNP